MSGLCLMFMSLLISEKPLEDKKDTFVEKLATQVIKNLQVKISHIHLRYEDDVSSYCMHIICLSNLQWSH